jgi:hypothetical protein
VNKFLTEVTEIWIVCNFPSGKPDPIPDGAQLRVRYWQRFENVSRFILFFLEKSFQYGLK